MSERDLIEQLEILSKKPYNGDPAFDVLVYHVAAALAALRDRDATIARLSEALAEAEKKEAEDWQPIETAPRDAEAVLITGGTWLYSESFAEGICDWTAVASFDPLASDNHKWNGGNGIEYDGTYWHNPTHWRPLPAPPRDLSQGGQHG